MSELSFRQARDKVKFSVILMTRRLEEPDENVPTCVFYYNEDGITMSPISDTYLADIEGMRALSLAIQEQVTNKKARFVFLVVSLVTEEGEYVHLQGHSREDICNERALLLRRRSGGPLLQKWEVLTYPFDYVHQLVAPSASKLDES